MSDDPLIIQLVLMITTDKRILRGKLLEACIEKQQILIDDFTNRISELLKSPGLGNEEAYDNEVLGQQSQRAGEVDGMHEALSLAKEEMNELLRLAALQSAGHSRVEPGAVVVTDRDTVFVCVSIEQFEVDGEPFVGISTRSPRYASMKGKQVGDKFQCAGVKYTIVDLF
jgi:hypothetical protein